MWRPWLALAALGPRAARPARPRARLSSLQPEGPEKMVFEEELGGSRGPQAVKPEGGGLQSTLKGKGNPLSLSPSPARSARPRKRPRRKSFSSLSGLQPRLAETPW